MPEAESRQEALVLLLQKRVELLKKKVEGAEGEYQQKLVEGGGRGREEGPSAYLEKGILCMDAGNGYWEWILEWVLGMDNETGEWILGMCTVNE